MTAAAALSTVLHLLMTLALAEWRFVHTHPQVWVLAGPAVLTYAAAMVWAFAPRPGPDSAPTASESTPTTSEGE